MSENHRSHGSIFPAAEGCEEVSTLRDQSQDTAEDQTYYTVKIEDNSNLECGGDEIQASFTVTFNTDTNDFVESSTENLDAGSQAEDFNSVKHDAQFVVENFQTEKLAIAAGNEYDTKSCDERSKVDQSLVDTFNASCNIKGTQEASFNVDHSNLSKSASKEEESHKRNESVVDNQVGTASVQIYVNRNENHPVDREENIGVSIRGARENDNIILEKESAHVEQDIGENVDNNNVHEEQHSNNVELNSENIDNGENVGQEVSVDNGGNRSGIRANVELNRENLDNDENVGQEVSVNVDNDESGSDRTDRKVEEDCDKTEPEATYKRERQPKDWSKQEIQDLLIKAINFRSPVKDVKTIIRAGIDVNAPVKNGLHPLHYAAYCDNDESVEVLINAGANINATDDIGYTPLHLCARRGNYRTMKVLIENGSMINFNEPGVMIRNTEETNKLGYTTTEPLNLAVQNAHPKCAKLLLENGARPNNKYFMGEEICLAPLDEVECLELLLQHGANPNVFNRCGLSPLMKACKDHHIPAVRTLLKYGADVNAICPPLFEQKSVLQFAIISGNIVIINILLQKGAKIGRQGEYNFNALHTAVMKGRSDICRILLQYRAEPDETTGEGATALMLACATPELKERKEIVQLLIDCGANVNAFSPNYSFFDPYLSPLTEYLKNVEDKEDFNIVELLVRQGAEVHFSSSGLDRELRRLRDPYSILPYCHCLENFPHIFDMLVNLANKYCPLLIHANEKLSESKQNHLLYTATRPRELKHQIRVLLRQKLTPGLPEKVEQLPLPPILKSYILYQ